MTQAQEREMHELAVRLAKITEGEGWEAMRYWAIGNLMNQLAEYCQPSTKPLPQRLPQDY